MWDYSDKVKEHFFSPQNAKVVPDANAKGDVGSLSCGDALSLTLKVDPESELIEDAGFQTFGCGSAIASSSVLTEMIIGRTLTQAQALTNRDIADYLDGLPPEKMHCSVMGVEALQAAIADYRGEVFNDDHEEGELICCCFGIDDILIRKVVSQNNLTSIDDVIHYTKAGGGCSTCHEKIEDVLMECLKEKELSEQDGSAEKIATIESILASVRPGIQADGGDVSLVELDDDMVFIAMSGNCSGCGMAGMTIADIEHRICEALGASYTVFPVQAPQAKEVKYG
ncbi:Fe-S cluster assembly protein NifU [Photobacterium sp. ZSDE20]|uniref:Nitrogen fixation protein NifU n=1 Tax=Photobacterium pectinilyticum TaxID=2906793 RepID=A0ABT1N1G4_9GAMM|nr:Fe-S cluster assembly protein NifU [Photobacterium sp. ZSDE20]MCQ1058573.1 Fe-S cluster assembly protein NifU [Photobacterium sp. ZSDE20]MDD1826306.1 Fe-S cluster assembly protein NifU [Photobacterium sp. ZSDE20]